MFSCPFLAISGLNNSSSSAAVNLHHQIVDNERFMMKYAAANSGSSDSHQRSKLSNDESSAASAFSDQTQSKKLNQSSTIQSGTTSTVQYIVCKKYFIQYVSLFHNNMNKINESIYIDKYYMNAPAADSHNDFV